MRTRNKHGDSDYKMHSLAPTPDLGCDDREFCAYKKYLKDTLGNPEMKNIALSGGIGCGKSSILRSFDKQEHNKSEKFLYISLMDFEEYSKPQTDKANLANTNESKINISADQMERKDHKNGSETNELEDDSEQTRKESNEIKHDIQKRVEYSLLCQILSHCKRRELRDSVLKGIPEHWFRIRHWLFSVLLTVVIFAITFPPYFARGAEWLGVPQQWRDYVHVLLYVILAISTGLVVSSVLANFRISSLKLKAEKIEAEMALLAEHTSLDMYKFELVYALTQIAKKIRYTVAFEDMDRIEPDVCVGVMTKLRELNVMVNLRQKILQRSRWFGLGRFFKPKFIKFIYAISEDVLDHELRTKFFDCVIPVISPMNQYTAEKLFKEELTKCGIQVSNKNPKTTEVFEEINPFLNHFRSVYNFCNELSVLKQLFLRDNCEDSDKYDYDCSVLLKMTFYKTLAPHKYAMVFSEEGRGEFQPVKEDELTDFSNENYRKSLSDILTRLSPSTLDLDLLIHSEKEVIEKWTEILNGKNAPRRKELSKHLSKYTRVRMISQIMGREENGYQDGLFSQERDRTVADNFALHVKNNVDNETFRRWIFDFSVVTELRFRNCINFISAGNFEILDDDRQMLFNWCYDSLSVVKECARNSVRQYELWDFDWEDTLNELLSYNLARAWDQFKDFELTSISTIGGLLARKNDLIPESAQHEQIDDEMASDIQTQIKEDTDTTYEDVLQQQIDEQNELDEGIEHAYDDPEVAKPSGNDKHPEDELS